MNQKYELFSKEQMKLIIMEEYKFLQNIIRKYQGLIGISENLLNEREALIELLIDNMA